ncbi:MAG: class I SAM-dependent methyltransferase [Amphiplicatus sp.]
MTENAGRFIGDIPKNYDQHLGPNIFEDFARDMARRAGALAPSSVLELAAGTGVVSRKLRDCLPAGARLVVSDLNPPMLDVARAKFRSEENVEFAVVDAMKLDYPKASFDLVLCQFGVMFFPDKRASFREVLRVLRPGGAYLFNAWGPMADNPFSQIAHEAALKYFPDDPPGFYRIPFSYADSSVVADDLEAAGFSHIERFAVTVERRMTDIGGFARGLVFGNPLIDEIESRKTVAPDEVVGAIARGLREAWGDAPMPLNATVFHARRA